MEKHGCLVTAAMWVCFFALTTAAQATTAWAPVKELIAAGGVSEARQLYVLPDGTAGALITDPYKAGSAMRTRDLDPSGAPVGPVPATLGRHADASGFAESSARTTLIWANRDGGVQMAERRAGAPAFGPPTTIATSAPSVSSVTPARANVAGAEVFAYADDAGDEPVTHLVSRAAGTSTWTDEALFEGAKPVGVGVSATGRIVMALYVDGAYGLTSASWDGEFTNPQWVGDLSDDWADPTFIVNGPGDALLAWHVGEREEVASDFDQYLTAHLSRDGVINPATPVPGAERNTEEGVATLDDSGRVTVAYTRSPRTSTAGVLFTVERRPDGTYTSPAAPGGLVEARSLHLDGDRAGNVVLAWAVSAGKVGLEAARRAPTGTWGEPQDVRIPCFAPGRAWWVADLRVHGSSSTLALAEFPTPGGSDGAQWLIARERPGTPAGRACGTPTFFTSPFAPPPVAGPTTIVLPSPPKQPSVSGQGNQSTPTLSLSTFRVVARPRRSARTARVRVGCSRACRAQVSIVHAPTNRTLAKTDVVFSAAGSREIILRLSPGAARVWRRAKPGTVRVRAEATSPGAAPVQRTIVLLPRR